VSFQHLQAVADLELGNPTAKLVLYQLARCACGDCGIAWPGIPYLALKTGLGATAVRKGLEWLEAAHYVRIHAYPKGGRGRSTEYVVAEGLMELSTAPCGECRKRMKTHRHAMGFDGSVTAKSGKPTASRAQNPPPGDTQEVIEAEEVRAADPPARQASPPGAAEPPLSEPPPNPVKARARVGELIRDLGAALGGESPAAGNHDPQKRRSEGTTAPRKP